MTFFRPKNPLPAGKVILKKNGPRYKTSRGLVRHENSACYEAEDMFRGTRYHEEISKNNSNHQSLESHATIVQLEMTVEWFQENIKDAKGHEQLRINFVQIKNIAYKKKFLPCDS
nr:6024_t:CDS:2 [Entrophospora candida]